MVKKINHHLEKLFFTGILFSFLKKEMAFNGRTLQHPREKLPQSAVSVLDSESDVNDQCGRFFITRQDLESRLNNLRFHFWKIEIFCKFVKNNFDTVIEKGFVYGDVHVFVTS